MTVVSMKALLETGVHFGHRTRRWNPKMAPYIFTKRNGIHIIDLSQTLGLIEEAYALIRDAVADGNQVLFVGTKRQAQSTIAREAARAQQPYVNVRWLGGTLTNWKTIRQRISYLENLEQRQANGELDLLKKRERLRLEREMEKLNSRLGGIRKMGELPAYVFIVDVNNEETAVREANILDIPIIGIVDTNSNPDPIEYVIPSNDDAIRAIKLICSKMADAAIEGRAMRETAMGEDGSGDDGLYNQDDFDGLGNLDDEALLGESTLAKLREASSEQETTEATETAESEETAAPEEVAVSTEEAAAPTEEAAAPTEEAAASTEDSE